MLERVRLDDYPLLPEEDQADLLVEVEEEEIDDTTGLSDDDDDMAAMLEHPTDEPLYVLPLYSLLPADKQALVFKPPPENHRVCVVATNVAETSITIPGVRYVVDTGKTKAKFYDSTTGVAEFRVVWESQASADQRAGRAGRTGPGHSYRLYSSAVFSDFEKFSPPEIVRRPIDDLVLQMKYMSIDRVLNFPFPTPPKAETLEAAEKLLIHLGALHHPDTSTTKPSKAMEKPAPKITALGKVMAQFPVAPRFAKILALSRQHGLMPYVVALVAGMSVQELVLSVPTGGDTDEEKKLNKEALQKRKAWAGKGNSKLLGDMGILLRAVARCSGATYEECVKYGVRHKALKEVQKLRAQLTNTVNALVPDLGLVLDPTMSMPSDLQCRQLRQIMLSGFGDRVAKKLPEPTGSAEECRKVRHSYQCTSTSDPVFIHPGSVLCREKCQYVIYHQLQETSKLYMKDVLCIDPEWLAVYTPSYCTMSDPLDEPTPTWDDQGMVMCHRNVSYGPHCWPLGPLELDFPQGLLGYKWFGCFFLSGQVCPQLSKYTSLLLSRPEVMTKTWSKLHPRTISLLKSLLTKEVSTHSKLLEVWTEDPKYLLSSYKEWIPQAVHAQVEELWPPRG